MHLVKIVRDIERLSLREGQYLLETASNDAQHSMLRLITIYPNLIPLKEFIIVEVEIKEVG
jgi:hypothetical protein